jgi:hypothetical protein
VVRKVRGLFQVGQKLGQVRLVETECFFVNGITPTKLCLFETPDGIPAAW